MAEVRASVPARRQLVAIMDHRGEEAGSSAEEGLRDAFGRFVLMLEQLPRVGTVTHWIGNDEFRQFPVEGFVVRFRVFPDGSVLIVDVRHGSMREPPVDVLDQQGFQPEGDQS